MGKAYISALSDGRFMVQIKIGIKDGKAVRKSKSFRSEEEALAKQAEWNEEYANVNIEKNAPVKSAPPAPAPSPPKAPAPVRAKKSKPSASMRYADYLNWFYSRDSIICGDVTKRSYFENCRKIKTILEEFGQGDITLGGMNEDIAMKILKYIAKRNGQSSVNKARLVMKQTIGEAFLLGFIEKDYTRLIKKVKSEKESEPRTAYSDEQVNTLLTLAKEHETLYPILCVFASTGVRPEELRCLEWSKLDWNRKTIRITNAVISKYDEQDIDSRSKEYEAIGMTKSKYGKRILPLDDRAMDALRDWRKQSAELKGGDSKYIFFSEDGGFATKPSLTQRWQKFLKRHGFAKQGYCLYRFRHFYCTYLIKKGMSVDKVKKLMGDGTSGIINEVYNHLSAEDVSDEARDLLNS
jgi:integrase